MEALNVLAVINDVDKICRTCLNEKDEVDMHFLYDDSLVEKLYTFTGCLQPSLGDGYPNYLCKECVQNLNSALAFKELTLTSDKRLQEIFLLEAPPKSNITLKELLASADKGTPIVQEPVANIENEKCKKKVTHEKEINSSTALSTSTAEDNTEDLMESKLHCSNQSEDKTARRMKYNCNLCKRVYYSKTGLELHLVMKHGKQLSCEVCGKTFHLIKQLNFHIKSHKGYKPFVCKLCKKAFASSSNLSKHMRVHGGEKKHVCTTCGMRFFEPGHLVIHTRSHTGEKPIVCKICQKRFADPHSLIVHKKTHTGERKYECTTCGKRFAHSFVLTAHARIHTGEKPYLCSICGMSYATSSYLTIHKRTHTQEKPFKCDICPKAFVSRCALVAHNMTHTGEKRFQCTICGRRVARIADLHTHLRSHTGEKPYKCDQCPKQYHTSSNLSAHKKTHLGLKDHVCSICQKGFGDPRTLKGHIRIHTGEKPYVCHICGNKYTQSGQLASHRKVHVNQSTTADPAQLLSEFTPPSDQTKIQENLLDTGVLIPSVEVIQVLKIDSYGNYFPQVNVYPE